MKKYFIREIGMMYNDDYFDAIKGFGGIPDSFDTLEEATVALKKITLKSLKQYSPMQLEDFYRLEENIFQAFDKYMIEHFGITIYNTSNDGKPILNYGLELPKDLTEEQAWEIREITGLPKMKIYEIQGEGSPFWGFRFGQGMKKEGEWLTHVGYKFNDNDTMSHADVPIFFLTKDEAHEYLKELSLSHHFSPVGIIGTFEELSDMPQILKTLVTENERIDYFENENRLILSRIWDNEKLLTVNSLLKNKFIEVALIPIEKVETVGGGWDPEM